MQVAFHIFTLVLVSVAMALSLAHALELPGKLRLDREAYVAVQGVYYPGFTFGGLVGELGGMVALAVLLYLLPWGTPRAWLVLAALILLAAGHATYWIMTHPVNGFWLKDADMNALGSRFFSTFSSTSNGDWTSFRNVWEASHAIRAVFFMAGFVAAATALAV